MKTQICLSIFFMLLLSISSIAQVKTEKYRNGRIAKQYALDKDGNYHGTFTSYTNAGKIIFKSNYLHGELHGSYVSYFDNGVPAEESTYYDGTLISQKRYKYFGQKRYLMYSATWSNVGKLLTAGMRQYNEYTGLGDWIETAGKLPNGYWSLAGYTEDSNYKEIYNGNDTTYVWFDKTKKQFKGKGINGQGYTVEYDKNGTLIKSPELALQMEREKAMQDSIVEANKLAEKQRIENESKAKEDTIANLKQNYENAFAKYGKSDFLYKDAINKYVIGQNEISLYTFLCKYLKKKKKKQHEIELQYMIASVLNIELNKSPIDKLECDYAGIKITMTTILLPFCGNNNADKLKANVDNILSRINYNSISQPYIPQSKTHKDIMFEMSYDKYIKTKQAYKIPENIQQNFNNQNKLLVIIQYCNDNNIVIK